MAFKVEFKCLCGNPISAECSGIDVQALEEFKCEKCGDTIPVSSLLDK